MLAINFDGTNMFEREKIQTLPWQDFNLPENNN